MVRLCFPGSKTARQNTIFCFEGTISAFIKIHLLILSRWMELVYLDIWG